MFRKILICAVLASPLIADPALAGNYHGYGAGPHQSAGRGQGWSRPVVMRGYYGGGGRGWSGHNAYGRGYAHFHRYGKFGYGYAAAAAWNSYNTGYRTAEPAYAENPQNYSAPAAFNYNQPIVTYRNATAYVPVTTYTPVPVRVYYVPQHEPYYNVPPYAVKGQCFRR